MAGADTTLASDGHADSPGLVLRDAGDVTALLATLRVVPAGRYRLGAEVGRGGMGHVVLAFDEVLGREVAIKRPRSLDHDSLRRFLMEAEAAAHLQHPGIIPVYETGVFPSGEPFLAMRPIDGRSLAEAITRAVGLAARLALLPHLTAVSHALAHAHAADIVHRDVKPSNVLIARHGETLLIDWGLAKTTGAPGGVEGAAGAEETVGIVGTPRYMSPEQARGAAADPRGDVYALGAMLYHLLAGVPPYHQIEHVAPADVLAAPPAPLPPGAPPELIAVMTRAMARDAAARYPSAADLAADLERYATGELVRAHDYKAGALLRRWARRRLAPLVAAAGTLAAVVVIAVSSYARIAGARDVAEDAERKAVTIAASGAHMIAFLIARLDGALDDSGRGEVFAGLGPKVQRYYEAVARSLPADGVELERRAAALAILGDVEAQQGDAAGAHVLYRAALAALDQAGGANPALHLKLEQRLAGAR